MYLKNYKEFKRVFIIGPSAFIPDIGRVTKSGYEINGNFLMVQRKKLDWLVELHYALNSSRLAPNENPFLNMSDTVINNKIVSLVNKFRYKNIRVNFEFESKSGYDINLYNNNISVAEAYVYTEHSQVIAVSDEGIPFSEFIDNHEKYITQTDYLILKQIGLYYQIKDAKSKKYTIGLQYNKMRMIYLYVNDIRLYRNQFQRPSFYYSFSLSFNMIF
jgi:hypothetical protein